MCSLGSETLTRRIFILGLLNHEDIKQHNFAIPITKYQLVIKCVTLLAFFVDFQGNLEASLF